MIDRKKFDRVMDILIIAAISIMAALVVEVLIGSGFDFISFIKIAISSFITNVIISFIIPAIKLGDKFAKHCGARENTFKYALLSNLIISSIYCISVSLIMVFIHNSSTSEAISTWLRLSPAILVMGYITSMIFMPFAIRMTHKILG